MEPEAALPSAIPAKRLGISKQEPRTGGPPGASRDGRVLHRGETAWLPPCLECRYLPSSRRLTRGASWLGKGSATPPRRRPAPQTRAGHHERYRTRSRAAKRPAATKTPDPTGRDATTAAPRTQNPSAAGRTAHR